MKSNVDFASYFAVDASHEYTICRSFLETLKIVRELGLGTRFKRFDTYIDALSWAQKDRRKDLEFSEDGTWNVVVHVF
jgi:hypothetical protein